MNVGNRVIYTGPEWTGSWGTLRKGDAGVIVKERYPDQELREVLFDNIKSTHKRTGGGFFILLRNLEPQPPLQKGASMKACVRSKKYLDEAADGLLNFASWHNTPQGLEFWWEAYLGLLALGAKEENDANPPPGIDTELALKTSRLLISAFSWVNTLEGEAFWAKRHLALEELGRRKPQAPCKVSGPTTGNKPTKVPADTDLKDILPLLKPALPAPRGLWASGSKLRASAPGLLPHPGRLLHATSAMQRILALWSKPK